MSEPEKDANEIRDETGRCGKLDDAPEAALGCGSSM
jgi:hypothetical protein